ncbi:jg4517, partial [Pararge aegeria aegeria]
DALGCRRVHTCAPAFGPVLVFGHCDCLPNQLRPAAALGFTRHSSPILVPRSATSGKPRGPGRWGWRADTAARATSRQLRRLPLDPSGSEPWNLELPTKDLFYLFYYENKKALYYKK